MYWELNLGTLQKQVFLTAEPSLPPTTPTPRPHFFIKQHQKQQTLPLVKSHHSLTGHLLSSLHVTKVPLDRTQGPTPGGPHLHSTSVTLSSSPNPLSFEVWGLAAIPADQSTLTGTPTRFSGQDAGPAEALCAAPEAVTGQEYMKQRINPQVCGNGDTVGLGKVMNKVVFRKMNYEAERTTLKSHCDSGKLIYLSEYFSLAPKLQVLAYLPRDSTDCKARSLTRSWLVLRKPLLCVLANCPSHCSAAEKRHQDYNNS